MKGKLIKETFGGVSFYTLFTDSLLIPYAKNGSGHGYMKLSLKNCETIERGYDLDEITEFIDYSNTEHLSEYLSDSHQLLYDEGYKEGFLKALEIISDKKFSERDMRKAMYLYKNTSITEDDIISSFQQTEWGVVVETEIIKEDVSDYVTGELCSWIKKSTEVYKFDSDGCLILKRI